MSRLQSVQLSALIGFLFTLSLVVAGLMIPIYGGSMDAADTEMRIATLANVNYRVFVITTAVFFALLVAVHWPKRQ